MASWTQRQGWRQAWTRSSAAFYWAIPHLCKLRATRQCPAILVRVSWKDKLAFVAKSSIKKGILSLLPEFTGMICRRSPIQINSLTLPSLGLSSHVEMCKKRRGSSCHNQASTLTASQAGACRGKNINYTQSLCQDSLQVSRNVCTRNCSRSYNLHLCSFLSY